MKRVLLLAFLVGCGGASSTPAKSRPAPTESDACSRMCAVYEDCRIAPPNCNAWCAKTQALYRPGVQVALTTCFEQELAGCEHRAMSERRELNSICFAAVLEAYSKDATTNDDWTRAVCALNAKCDPDPDPNCEARIRESYKNSTENKLLALVRPEMLARAAKCIETAPCDELHPMDRCLLGHE